MMYSTLGNDLILFGFTSLCMATGMFLQENGLVYHGNWSISGNFSDWWAFSGIRSLYERIKVARLFSKRK